MSNQNSLDAKVQELQLRIWTEIQKEFPNFPDAYQVLRDLIEIDNTNKKYRTSYMTNGLFSIKDFKKKELPLYK